MSILWPPACTVYTCTEFKWPTLLQGTKVCVPEYKESNIWLPHSTHPTTWCDLWRSCHTNTSTNNGPISRVLTYTRTFNHSCTYVSIVLMIFEKVILAFQVQSTFFINILFLFTFFREKNMKMKTCKVSNTLYILNDFLRIVLRLSCTIKEIHN